MDRKMNLTMPTAFLLLTHIVSAGVREFDVTKFGAVGDGRTPATISIQEAIDACSSSGGGRVILPAGRFVTGTIYLKDHVVLRVSAGAELLGSTNIADYATDTFKNLYKNEPHMDRCLIFARGARGIGIEGHGVIDGRGQRAHFPNPNDAARHRPMLIRFLECENIRVRDITLKNPAAWTWAWLYCSDIAVDGITISSRANNNGDGLDFDGCERVRVSNSAFDTSDDSICLQASRPDRPCRDVTISNCIFVSKWAGIRIGLLSRGDFRNVTVANCVFRDIDDSGLKIQMCEGGVMENMTFSNLVMANVPRPIFMTFCQQRACVDAPDELAPMNAMRRFNFNGLIVDNSGGNKHSGLVLSGLPGHPIEAVSISNVQMTVAGGGTDEDARRESVPELTPEVLAGWWPEYRLIGPLSAHGVYARHLKGLILENISFQTRTTDARPAVVLDDVSHAVIRNVQSNGRKTTPKQ